MAHVKVHHLQQVNLSPEFFLVNDDLAKKLFFFFFFFFSPLPLVPHQRRLTDAAIILQSGCRMRWHFFPVPFGSALRLTAGNAARVCVCMRSSVGRAL
jgi:hypothetical protein